MDAQKKATNIVVSGAQPTGTLHVGNYFGSFANWLKLQNDPSLRCFFFIADYHSLTIEYDPAQKRQQIIDLATDLLAMGLDPKKCVLFLQSDVMEHTELGWIFNTVTPMSFLERMTQFKDKSADNAQNVNVGLFDYPVLQAADILLYKADRVPVGRDQVQHVELTRDIARFFNNRFGDAFPEPKPLLTEVPKVRSLTDPLKKMSKSHGERTYIALTDGPDEILAKVKRAMTETTGTLTIDEKALEERLASHVPGSSEEEVLRGHAGVWNLMTLLRSCGRADVAERFLASQPMKYSDLKASVAEAVAAHFADFRARRAELAKDPAAVEAVLAHGAEQARAIARATMEDVRKRIGIR
jgi:tryptophanyl-tRNA synthetase